MKIKVLLFFIFTLTLTAFGFFIVTVFNTPPSQVQTLAKFYISLFVLMFGLLYLLSYFVYWLKMRLAPSGTALSQFFRISLLGSMFTLSLLGLQSARQLTIITGVILAILFLLAEIGLRRRTLKSGKI